MCGLRDDGSGIILALTHAHVVHLKTEFRIINLASYGTKFYIMLLMGCKNRLPVTVKYAQSPLCNLAEQSSWQSLFFQIQISNFFQECSSSELKEKC